MKNIFFIRHAKSDWEDITLKDFDRPLAPRGHRDAAVMPVRLQKVTGLERPDLIVSSPAVRTQMTARYFADFFKIPPFEIDLQADLYEAHLNDALWVLRNTIPNHIVTVFVFGHNPCMTHLANYFADEWIENIPTCGIFQLTADITEWSELHETNTRRVGTWFPKDPVF